MDFKVMYENIPDGLQRLNNWVLWLPQTDYKTGKVKKVPKDAKTMLSASCDKPASWSSFHSCVEVHQGSDGIGMGFNYGDSPFVFLDIDHCLDAEGKASPLAEDIIQRLNTYTEISPSGTGLHLILEGALPENFSSIYKHKVKHKTDEFPEQETEIYDSGRYGTITGNVYCGRGVISTVKGITDLLDEYFLQTKGEVIFHQVMDTSFRTVVNPLEADAIIKIACASKNGNRFKALFCDGDISEYGNDASSADLALCNLLAFWCRKDIDMMDELFRRSALYQPEQRQKKWNEKHKGAMTYGEMTLVKAIGDTVNVFGDGAIRQGLQAEEDFLSAEELDGIEVIVDSNGKYDLTDKGNAERFADDFRGHILHSGQAKKWFIYDGHRWMKDLDSKIIRYAHLFINSLKDELVLANERYKIAYRSIVGGITSTNKEVIKIIKEICEKTPPSTRSMESARDARLEKLQRLDKAEYERVKPLVEQCDILDRLCKQLQHHIYTTSKTSNIKSFLEQVKGLLPIHDITKFDADDFIINCKNCAVDLRTGEQLAHSPELMLSKMTNCIYDADDDATPCFNSFLKDITLGRDDLAVFLQDTLGYSMTGDTMKRSFFVCQGAGSNGKSTLLELIGRLLGDYACSMDISTIMQTKYNKVGSDVARLQGVRFVRTAESCKGDRFNESLLKQMTGGEGELTASFKFENEVDFRPKLKLWISTNNIIKIDSIDDAMETRLNVIPFDFKATNKDEQLPRKLSAESTGVFNWLLAGCQRALAMQGFSKPKPVVEAEERYKQDCNFIRRFIHDCVAEYPQGSEMAGMVYDAFIQWCCDEDELQLSQRAFYDRMDNLGIQQQKSKHGKIMLGITLTLKGKELAEERLNKTHR